MRSRRTRRRKRYEQAIEIAEFPDFGWKVNQCILIELEKKRAIHKKRRGKEGGESREERGGKEGVHIT